MSDDVRMNPDVKTAWVAALRSGDYEQGQELLHQVDGARHLYCCLGVLCDLAYRAGVVERYEERTGVRFSYADPAAVGAGEVAPEGSVLPRAVARWAGLVATVVDDDHGPLERVLTDPTVEGTELTVWNDGEPSIFDDEDEDEDGRDGREPASFTVIADLIERNL